MKPARNVTNVKDDNKVTSIETEWGDFAGRMGFSTFLTFLTLFTFFTCLGIARAAVEAPDIGWIHQQEKDQERDLHNQVRDLLDRMLGPNHDSMISVSVSRASGGETEINIIHTDSKRETKPWLMPGIEAPRDTGPTDSVEKRTQRPIVWRRIMAVTISETFKDRVTSLNNLIKTQLNMNGPNDRVEVTTAPFAIKGAIGNITTVAQDKGMLMVIMLGFGMLIFTVFLFGPIRGFMKGMAGAMAESKARQFSIEMGGGGAALGGGPAGIMAGGAPGAMMAGGAMPPGAQMASLGSGGATLEALPAGSEENVVVETRGGGGPAHIKFVRPFSFIKKANIPNLVYLVQEEPPEIVALIMSYLNPDEGAELMSALPTDLQTKVAVAMATVKQASHESVMRAEDAIRKKLDFLVGGVERFITILDRVDPVTREEILATLAKDSPALVERVKRELFTFENLQDLDDPALQLVLREIKTDALAKALKDAAETMVEKVKKNISAGAQTLLAEEMQLQGYVTPVQVDEERRKIIDTVRKMEKEGKVAIKRTRVKAEKIDRIQRLEEGMDLPVGVGVPAGLPAGTSGENLVGSPAGSRASLGTTERKVGLSDYEGRARSGGLSMASLLKQNPPGEKLVGIRGRESASSKEAQKESLVGGSTPASGETDAQQSLRQYQVGSTAYEAQSYEPAIAAYQKCVELDPNFWQGYQGLGNCYTALGMVTEAVAAYEQALRLQPNNPGLRQWLDDYKSKQGAA